MKISACSASSKWRFVTASTDSRAFAPWRRSLPARTTSKARTARSGRGSLTKIAARDCRATARTRSTWSSNRAAVAVTASAPEKSPSASVARSRMRPSTCMLVTAATKPLASVRFSPSQPRTPEIGVEERTRQLRAAASRSSQSRPDRASRVPASGAQLGALPSTTARASSSASAEVEDGVRDTRTVCLPLHPQTSHFTPHDEVTRLSATENPAAKTHARHGSPTRNGVPDEMAKLARQAGGARHAALRHEPECSGPVTSAAAASSWNVLARPKRSRTSDAVENPPYPRPAAPTQRSPRHARLVGTVVAGRRSRRRSDPTDRSESPRSRPRFR